MHEYRCKLVKIVDGDTVDVDIDLGFGVWLRKQRIRLYGIDTPESRTRDLEEKYYGKLSSAFLQKHCPKGSYITLRTHLDKKGKFGRILGDFLLEDRRATEQMIVDGHAVNYHGGSKLEIEALHLLNRTLLLEKGSVDRAEYQKLVDKAK